jgi:N,N-dimethylformamidase beta subunit-like, C-terminal
MMLLVGRRTPELLARPPSAGRARALRLAACAAVAAGAHLAPLAGAASAATPRNPIQIENARRGTAGWLRPEAPSTLIAGYSLTSSVAPGDTLSIAVSAAAGTQYRVLVYRLGWYRGVGARLVACTPSCTASETGSPQTDVEPDPARELVVDENWRVTDTLPVKSGWTSGYYFAELVVTSGAGAGEAARIPFIVRAAPGTHSAILVVAPVDTWQAYNFYGGTSFYVGPANETAGTVSFDRPYAVGWSQSPLYYDYPLVRFLERSGYDVSYTTDVDLDTDPGSLLQHRLDIVAGHSEYWSGVMYDGLKHARDTGVNLAFLGGNDGYREISYEGAGRTMIKGDYYRHEGLPECNVTGLEWQGGWVGDGVETASTASGDWLPAQAYSVDPQSFNDPWFRGTGFTASSSVPGIVGYEWDGVEPGCVSGETVLFQHTGTTWPPNQRPEGYVTTDADAVRYTVPSGATVFAAGSIEFSWGLDGFARRFGGDHVAPDPRLQRFMRNVFDELSKSR